MPSSQPILKDYFKHWLTYETNTASQDHYATGKFVTYTGDKSGGFNPGWRDDVRNHRSAGTPFAGELFRWEGSTRGSARTEFVGTSNPALKLGEKVDGDILSPSDFGAINLPTNSQMKARVLNAALVEFYNHAWSALRSFQGGVFLGEVREALHMIKNPARAIRKGLNDYSSEVNRRIRRSNRGRPPSDKRSTESANRIASDTWLEYMFGWRPLFSDVRSAASAFDRLARSPHEYKKVSAHAEEDYSVIPANPLYIRNIATFTQYWFSVRRRSGYSCRIIGEVKCSVSNPVTMSSEVLGFTAENFVPTVWELIPYSFLVDYFSNIGDVISAWSFPQSSLAWHNKTMRTFAEREVLAWIRGAFNPNPGDWKLYQNEGSRLYVRQFRSSVERDPHHLGFPSVSLELPGSNLKWINIAALANMRRAV